MKTKIITSGKKYIDIDAFACLFAYKELLDLKNQKSKIVTTAKFNASITKKYRNINFNKETPNLENVEFIILDLSDPNYFEKFLDLNLVSHIFDHHIGFEDFWKQKIGNKCVIESIGAAATLVFREYKKARLLDKISPLSAELLAVAILSNTLNFQAKITKEEDKIAFKELINFFDYSETFKEQYFLEVQKNIEENIFDSLKNDSKKLNSELFIAQLEVWDLERITSNFQKEIKQFLQSANSKVSFLNLIGINEKKNILICNNDETLEYIKHYFPEFNFQSGKKIIITPHVILRKEIIAKISKNNKINN